MRIKSGDLYVSCVEGHIVARFGSHTSTVKAQQIGVYPVVEVQKDGSQVFVGSRWDPAEVVFISRAEYLANLKAYDNELAANALVVRTKADFDAWLKTEAEKSAKDAPKAEEKKPEKPAAPAA